MVDCLPLNFSLLLSWLVSDFGAGLWLPCVWVNDSTRELHRCSNLHRLIGHAWPCWRVQSSCTVGGVFQRSDQLFCMYCLMMSRQSFTSWAFVVNAAAALAGWHVLVALGSYLYYSLLVTVRLLHCSNWSKWSSFAITASSCSCLRLATFNTDYCTASHNVCRPFCSVRKLERMLTVTAETFYSLSSVIVSWTLCSSMKPGTTPTPSLSAVYATRTFGSLNVHGRALVAFKCHLASTTVASWSLLQLASVWQP